MIGALDAGPGAVVSHRSAAALWHLPGFGFGQVEVSLARGRAAPRPTWARLHRPTVLAPSHVTQRHGLPVTTLARTLLDLAGDLHPARLALLVDRVTAKSPAILAALHGVLVDLGVNGRPGVSALRAVLEDRPVGYVAPASGLEARFERVLAAAGEPPLERQVDLGGHEWVGRVDFLDRALRVVVEVDSDLHHTSLLDRVHDRSRDERLRGAGWHTVVRVTEEEVWRRPERAVQKVRDARARARATLLGAKCGAGGSISAAESAGGAGAAAGAGAVTR